MPGKPEEGLCGPEQRAVGIHFRKAHPLTLCAPRSTRDGGECVFWNGSCLPPPPPLSIPLLASPGGVGALVTWCRGPVLHSVPSAVRSFARLPPAPLRPRCSPSHPLVPPARRQSHVPWGNVPSLTPTFTRRMIKGPGGAIPPFPRSTGSGCQPWMLIGLASANRRAHSWLLRSRVLQWHPEPVAQNTRAHITAYGFIFVVCILP